VIVIWGFEKLGALLGELGVGQPLLVASQRWQGLDMGVPIAGTWSEVPSKRVGDAAAAAAGADSVLALGGGSAIDLSKAISAETGLPLVSMPTTYAGAEWTPYYGIRDRGRRMQGGGAGAHLAGVVYEPRLTLNLGIPETVGTSMNALAHCAEALYVQGRNPEADRHALVGARLIGTWLPRVVASPADLPSRTNLLGGAMNAGMALGKSMLALGHAMAQALGGRYGLPHGTLNGIVLPAALRFNQTVAPRAIEQLGGALETDDPIARVEELARLGGGATRLRDLDVPDYELGSLAEAVVQRPGARANPREADAAQVEELLRSVW
jgi:maleylacetate reductase